MIQTTNRTARIIAGILAGLLCVVGAGRAQAGYMLSSLVSFDGPDGINPEAGLVSDASGNLYGTTAGGGYYYQGSVFKFTPTTGAITTLASFNSQSEYLSFASLAFGPNGNLYGTTSLGGTPSQYVGAVFSVNPTTGALSTVAAFNGANGAQPQSTPVFDSSGNLFGTAAYGGPDFTGANTGEGTVFKLNPNTGSLTALASFDRANGMNPTGSLIFDASGNLYGTTLAGGTLGAGTVFKVNPTTGAITTLISFNTTNGSRPLSNLIFDADSDLYGTTEDGGAYNDGTVFKLNPTTGVLTTLVSFDGANGKSPEAGLIFDGAGNLYSTTAGGGPNSDGVVFEFTPSTGLLTTLLAFNGANGKESVGNLIFDSNDDLFGTADSGGAYNDGTIFELSPVPEPSTLALAAR